jgi:hypothetical protein
MNFSFHACGIFHSLSKSFFLFLCHIANKGNFLGFLFLHLNKLLFECFVKNRKSYRGYYFIHDKFLKSLFCFSFAFSVIFFLNCHHSWILLNTGIINFIFKAWIYFYVSRSVKFDCPISEEFF